MTISFYFLMCIIISSWLSVCDGKRFYITRWGACSDCEKRGYNFNWCYLGKRFQDWDYCSTRPGYTTRDEKCIDECAYKGFSFLWCRLADGNWDYCSQIEDTTLLEYTFNGDECQNYCDLDGPSPTWLSWWKDNDVYQCRKKDNSYARCSPAPGVASDGARCKNPCASGPDDIFWCWTDDSSWEYCSIPQEESTSVNFFAEFFTTSKKCSDLERKKIEVTAVQREGGARLLTLIFVDDPNTNRLRSPDKLSNDLERDAYKCVRGWQAGLPSDRSHGKSTLHTFGKIRLDRQGETNTINYGTLQNYQLQINGLNVPWPTSIAHINIPAKLKGYNGRGYRRLFARGMYLSLLKGATVWIVQRVFSKNEDVPCPIRGPAPGS